jgi:hypothetical protein
MTDRRTDLRYPVSVAVHAWNSNMDFFHGHTRNISGSGVYIIGKTTIKPHDRLVFLMALPGLLADEKATPVWAFCRVMRVEPHDSGDGTVGIAAVVEEYEMPTYGPGTGIAPPQPAANPLLNARSPFGGRLK